jgi:hypothetical protein
MSIPNWKTIKKKVVKLMIEKGANLNLVDNFGYTPLHLAAQKYEQYAQKVQEHPQRNRRDYKRLQLARLLKVIVLLETAIQRR